MKDQETVIAEFNELVNMTAADLDSWLKSGDSKSAGWPKENAGGNGQTVGHDSGRKIVKILNANPDKVADKYTDDQITHMRKVVAYWSQISDSKEKASLKNWGHDFLKAQGEANESNGPEELSSSEEIEKKSTRGARAGTKRKNTNKPSGANKKHQTRGNATSEGSGKQSSAEDEDQTQNHEDSTSDAEHVDSGEDSDAESNDEDEHTGVEEEVHTDEKSQGKIHDKGPSEGDIVSWTWGSGHPEGEVIDVKGHKTTITTKRGNKVSRNGKDDDPAVVIDTGKSKAIKLAHELD
ncbi:hypothetical protein G7Z17_g1784 [Cylindrodendrum hubeiense]|uniref:Hypervirulence associated protein TUDOR domain-containing protein n=1 Tax=Cylindrodendrum hubeiense TaxID=595255 RepID=A0A9P5HE71_9HYPO|nr:hypothetical protein G7Z17_g1784 [Cylindrodendrum hubeiense]